MQDLDPFMNIRSESALSPISAAAPAMSGYFQSETASLSSAVDPVIPTEFLALFCRHFGLNQTAILQQESEALHQQICDLVSALLDGVIQLKQGVKHTQQSFNLNTNNYRPVHNNPLDLAVNAKHALEMLLKERDETFLSITEAIPQTINQIIQHQLALSIAAEKAAITVFEAFKPERFAQEGLARTRIGRLRKDASSWRAFLSAKQQSAPVTESVHSAMAESYKQSVGDVR